MHAVALIFNTSCSDQVGAQRVILRQICREVHFLPLKLLAQLLLAREAKLTQMPASDKVDLAVCWGLVHFIRVSFITDLHVIRVNARVSTVVPQQEGVLLANEPALICWEFKYAVFV